MLYYILKLLCLLAGSILYEIEGFSLSDLIVKNRNKLDTFLPSRSSIFKTAHSNNYTLSHKFSFDIPNPSYVQILQKGLLSVTSFSFLQKGFITQYNLNNITHSKTRTLNGDYLWPNELTSFTDSYGDKRLIIPDGFLFPGQNNGGLFCIKNPDDPKSKPVRITTKKTGWFYHRACYIKLPGEGGHEGILTARAIKPLFGIGRGELVWLTPRTSVSNNTTTTTTTSSSSGSSSSSSRSHISTSSSSSSFNRSNRHDMKDNIKKDNTINTMNIHDQHSSPSSSFSSSSSSSLSSSASSSHSHTHNHHDYQLWDETVLVEGPDVMFETVDIDPSDSTIEIISAHFFGQKLTVHSLQSISYPPYVKISDTYLLDTVGLPYGLCLATMPNVSDDDNNTISTDEQYVKREGDRDKNSHDFIQKSNEKSVTRRDIPILSENKRDNNPNRYQYTIQNEYSVDDDNISYDIHGRRPNMHLKRSKQSWSNTQLYVHTPTQKSMDQSLTSSLSTSNYNYQPESDTNHDDDDANNNEKNNNKSNQQNSKSNDDNRYSSNKLSSTLIIPTNTQKGIQKLTKKKVKPYDKSKSKLSRTYNDDSIQTSTTNENDENVINSVITEQNSQLSISKSSMSSSSSINSTSMSSTAPTHVLVTTHECKYDIWSTIKMAIRALTGCYPRIKTGESVSHEYSGNYDQEYLDSQNYMKVRELKPVSLGGSLFAYELPKKLHTPTYHTFHHNHVTTSMSENSIMSSSLSSATLSSSSSSSLLSSSDNIDNLLVDSTDLDLSSADTTSTPSSSSSSLSSLSYQKLDWKRHTLCTGFKVKGWGGIFSPGAPGFPYVFDMPLSSNTHSNTNNIGRSGNDNDNDEENMIMPSSQKKMPLILVAGDCTGSAYIFTPRATSTTVTSTTPTSSTSSYQSKEMNGSKAKKSGTNVEKEVEKAMVPIYDLAFEIECGATVGSAAATPALDGSNAIDIYLPSYELNQVHAFRLTADNLSNRNHTSTLTSIIP